MPGVEGKYLSADYSTLPPRVVLTTSPTEWSRWEVTSVVEPQPVDRNPLEGARIVRNINGRKQDAWLALSKIEYVRDPVQTYSVVQPILSFDLRTQFHWRTYRPDDTSK